jgi:hypothetical protein
VGRHPPAAAACSTRRARRASVAARALALLVTLAPALGFTACRADDAASARQRTAAQGSALAEVRGARRLLEARRAELRGARAAAEERAAGAVRSDDADLAELEKEVDARAAELNRRLVELLNEDPPHRGEPTAYQRELLTIKIAEDLVLAREYIEEGGDHAGAIAILRKTLELDPESAAAREALARAERERFMSRERFAGVGKGMSAAEVRARLGPPHPGERRSFPEREVEVWFYPRQSGAKAAVFFERKQDGRLVVYQVDFDAVAPRGGGERLSRPEGGSASGST